MSERGEIHVGGSHRSLTAVTSAPAQPEGAPDKPGANRLEGTTDGARLPRAARLGAAARLRRRPSLSPRRGLHGRLPARCRCPRVRSPTGAPGVQLDGGTSHRRCGRRHWVFRAPRASRRTGYRCGDRGARWHGGHRRAQAVPVRSGGHLQRLGRHRGHRAGRDPHRHLPGQLMTVMGPEGAHDWCPVNVGATTVGVAERDALGTTARVVVWPPHWTGRAVAAVDAELALLDKQASRFRRDSEISRLHNALAPPADTEDPPLRRSSILSEGLAEAITVALAAAEWTGGLVDPTVGGALCGLGYDRDFAALLQGVVGEAVPPEPGYVPGWQSVRLDGRRLRLAAGVRLDLGATAKGLGSDRSARAAAACVPGGGVLVSLGGDIAMAGDAPLGGWPVLVSDEPDQHGAAPAACGARQVCPPEQPY